MRYLAGSLALLLSASAFAQEPEAPPESPCAGPEAQRDPRCRGENPGPIVGPVNVGVPVNGGGAQPAVHPASPSGTGSSSGGCGGLNDKGALVIVAVAAVALPAVLYAVDSEADPEDVARYDDFKASATVWGGAMNTNGSPFGLAGLRAAVTYARIGAEGTFEGSPLQSDWRTASGAFLFRLPTHRHVELTISGGVRWTELDGVQRLDAEIAVPHRYVLFRAWGQGGGIDVRPAVLFNPTGGDIRVDAGFFVPLGPLVTIGVSGRLFTFNWQRVNEAVVGSITVTPR
jgi:hypothetical protein